MKNCYKPISTTARRSSGDHRSIIAIGIVLYLFFAFIPIDSTAQSSKKVWIYFIDKGPGVASTGSLQKGTAAYHDALAVVTPRALKRRAKVLPADQLIDAADHPLYESYIRQIETLGSTLVQESRWLNAASFVLTPDQTRIANGLPFVIKTQYVVTHTSHREMPVGQSSFEQLCKSASLDYGNSARQLQLINVPSLHNFGATGNGVFVGMLDSGFRWRAHEALAGRHVVAEHDFIFNRDSTSNGPNDTQDQDAHGTLTMSVIGGYMPGKLIGPAFDADFALAKTELIYPSAATDYDTKAEEDNWVAGIEWLEAQGVEIVSSSLGYNDFVDTTSYTWENGDFNGRTTVSALAAVRAARLGVVVCNGMGNEGNGDGVTGTLLTPADADSIISVGAVNYSDELTSFSSTGPTNDGRIKPDVVAPGYSVYGATTPGPSTYTNSSGTSLSTPLTAGAAALLLSIRPDFTPIQIRDALRNTATSITDPTYYPSSPNNFTGWGLINAYRAAISVGVFMSNEPTVTVGDSKNIMNVVSIFVVSKFGVRPDSVILHFAGGTDSVFTSIHMTLDSAANFPTSGRYKVTIPAQALGSIVRFTISVSDSAGNSYQSPASIRDTVWQLRYGVSGLYPPSGSTPAGYALLQNYPNPFNSSTIIRYELPRTDHVVIRIFNVLGQVISTLLNETQSAGSYSIRLDGSNLPTGVYVYRLTSQSFIADKKMLLIR